MIYGTPTTVGVYNFEAECGGVICRNDYYNRGYQITKRQTCSINVVEGSSSSSISDATTTTQKTISTFSASTTQTYWRTRPSCYLREMVKDADGKYICP